MRRTSSLLAAVAALALVLQPGFALARAGGGGSFGSRGGMTFSPPPATRTAPYSAAPIERSLTPRSAAPSYGSQAPGYAAPARSGFGSGLLGGLVGVGLGSMLFGGFGHGFGFGGGFGLLWLLIRIAIVVMLVRWVWRLLHRNAPAYAGAASMFSRNRQPGGPPPMASGRAAPPPVAIGPDDYRAFEQNLHSVQDAWSRSDLNALGTLATPEMVSYFADQLSDYASRGQRNTVTDVSLVSGDLSQAWAEQGRDYATVAMRFAMIDVTRDSTGRITDGSPTEHVTATELWTFVRAHGGRWILSAIQQAR
ncbi:MAG: TIM44-like domain-containing protein [Acetobacteraceae bacterium]